MKNQKSVFVNGSEYLCTQFFDVNTQIDGVDIKNESGKHIGEILGVVIPDIDADDEENEIFDEIVIDFVNETSI
jgi:hypothetical protein